MVEPFIAQTLSSGESQYARRRVAPVILLVSRSNALGNQFFLGIPTLTFNLVFDRMTS